MGAQYERGAYAALAEQYKREALILRTQTAKRLANHWKKYEAACVAAWRADQRHQLEQAITESLAWASQRLGERLTTLQHLVASILAEWPRTSSSIECLNSLLRPFLNGRKHVSQGFLDLFRFYHNTHQFVRGQRAGSSPLELAGGPRIAEGPLAFLGLGKKA